MPVYSYDHIHLRSHDPMATAQYYQRMFDAKIVESIQSDGRPRIDLDINGLTVFLARVPEDAEMLRHRLAAHRQALRQLCRGRRTRGQPADQLASSRVAKRGEDILLQCATLRLHISQASSSGAQAWGCRGAAPSS